MICDGCGEEVEEAEYSLMDGWVCPGCTGEPDFEGMVRAKHDRQEDDFNARWPK